jgi:hypothetical protein
MSTELFKDFARLRRLGNATEAQIALEIARKDDHNLVCPSHLVVKNEKIVGHFSIMNAPFWFGHLSKEHVTPHDTFRLIHAVETTMAMSGSPHCLTLVGTESKLHPKMPELGYRFLGNADIFIKDLP